MEQQGIMEKLETAGIKPDTPDTRASFINHKTSTAVHY